MSDQPPTPPAAGDNETIKQMRDQIAAQEAARKKAEDDLKAAQDRLTEIERAKMDDLTRTQAELADAKAKAEEAEKLRTETETLSGKFKSLYEQGLAAIPEEKRELVARLTGNGTYAERFEALTAARELAGVPSGPVTGGTVTQPGGGAPSPEPPGKPEPLSVDQVKKMSFASAVKASPIMQNRAPNGMEEIQAEIKALREEIRASTNTKT